MLPVGYTRHRPASVPSSWRLAMSSLDRRRFLQTSAASLAALPAVTAAGAAARANDKIVLAVMGVRGRGRDLIRGFGSFDDVEIAYVIDPDANMVAPALNDAE